MTVIRGKQNINYPKPNSAAASDTESLYVGSVSASDTESINDEPNSTSRLQVFRPLPVKASHIEELINIKKGSGKKKLRRYQNRCVLQTLNEEEENESLIVIMESYKSPFARLLEDKDAMEYWNEFIEKSEEDQTKIVQAFANKYLSRSSQTGANNKNNNIQEKQGRISSRFRRTFKIRKNLSLEILKVCEDDLIEFFKTTPSDVYVKCPPTSFDRLLLHAIAQYHKLKSISISVEDGLRRSVEVHNTSDNWTPADFFLTDFIKQLRT